MATRLLLIRHGGTVLSLEDRFAGSTDVELSPDGKSQAALLSRRLAKEKIAAIYCSPLRRAIDTANAIAARHTASPKIMAGLREIDHGQWEGMVHKEVEQKFAAEYLQWSEDPFMRAPPGGERGVDVLARAMPAYYEIAANHPDATVAVVSHKATNRVVLAFLAGMDLRTYRDRIDQALACVNVILWKSAREAKLVLMNDVSHYANLPK